MAGSLRRRLGGGEKRVKQKLEIARRHTSGVTSQSGTLLAPPSHTVPEARHKYTWWLRRTSLSRMSTAPLRSMMTRNYACIIAPHRTCSARCRCSATHLFFYDSGFHDLPPLRNGAFRSRRYSRLRIGIYPQLHHPCTQIMPHSCGRTAGSHVWSPLVLPLIQIAGEGIRPGAY